MLTTLIAISAFSWSTLGLEFSQIVSHDFGSMLKRGDALAKRQGYYPSSTPCGSGTTCAEACGATQIECPADVGRGVCFDPSLSRCCPDGSGYSCDSGYFCSSDGQKNTYCCPDGMDLETCAGVYSLTVSLISQTGTVEIPSETNTIFDSVPTSTPTSTTPIYIMSTQLASSTLSELVSLSTPTASAVPSGNISYTTGTPVVEFQGAAAKAASVGMAVLVGVVGLAI